MLSRDYSGIKAQHNDPNREKRFPKDDKHGKISLLSGLCCFTSTQGGGQVALADELKHRILVFNPDGTKKHTIGLKGLGNGEFLSPKNIAVSPEGKLVVADSANHRLQSFDSLGQLFQCKWQAHAYDIKKGRQVRHSASRSEQLERSARDVECHETNVSPLPPTFVKRAILARRFVTRTSGTFLTTP